MYDRLIDNPIYNKYSIIIRLGIRTLDHKIRS